MERWASTSVDHAGRPRSEDADVRARLGRAAAEIEVSTLLARRCAWVQSSGTLPGVEGSMAKLFATEALTRQSADFMDMLGPDGIRADGDPDAVAHGIAEYLYRFALGTTTYGGTSEIQRNIIAQRGLGLPRRDDVLSRASGGERVTVTSAGVPFGTQIHRVARADPRAGRHRLRGRGRQRADGHLRSARRAVDPAGPRPVGAWPRAGRPRRGLPPQLPGASGRRRSRGGRSAPWLSRCVGISRSGSGTGCWTSSAHG